MYAETEFNPRKPELDVHQISVGMLLKTNKNIIIIIEPSLSFYSLCIYGSNLCVCVCARRCRWRGVCQRSHWAAVWAPCRCHTRQTQQGLTLLFFTSVVTFNATLYLTIFKREIPYSLLQKHGFLCKTWRACCFTNNSTLVLCWYTVRVFTVKADLFS